MPTHTIEVLLPGTSMRRVTRLTPLALLVAGLSAASAQPIRPNVDDLPYAQTHRLQMLDVYFPAGLAGELQRDPSGLTVERRPLIIWIHGGGWHSGSKDTFASTPKLRGLLERGYVVASIDYRLSGDAVFPAQIHDCKAAVRFLRGMAPSFGIDPRRIGVWGSSAGGHLVALLGTSAGVPEAEGTEGGLLGISTRVQSVADHFGPADFLNVPDWHLECTSGESRLLGFCLGDLHANRDNPEWAEEVALAELAGPVTHATRDDPPFIIAHGTADETVLPLHSELLHAALLDAGVFSVLRLVEGAGHGLPLSENDPVYAHFASTLAERPCPTDVNRDQVRDVFDVLAYFRRFGMNDPAMDVDLSGRLDVFDVLAFFERFTVAC